MCCDSVRTQACRIGQARTRCAISPLFHIALVPPVPGSTGTSICDQPTAVSHNYRSDTRQSVTHVRCRTHWLDRSAAARPAATGRFLNLSTKIRATPRTEAHLQTASDAPSARRYSPAAAGFPFQQRWPRRRCHHHDYLTSTAVPGGPRPAACSRHGGQPEASRHGLRRTCSWHGHRRIDHGRILRPAAVG